MDNNPTKFFGQNIWTSVAINMLFWGENTSAVVSFEVTFKFCLKLLIPCLQLEKYTAKLNGIHS